MSSVVGRARWSSLVASAIGYKEIKAAFLLGSFFREISSEMQAAAVLRYLNFYVSRMYGFPRS